MMSLYQRAFPMVGGFSFKVILALGSITSAALGVVFGEGLTQQWGSAGLAGTLAATITTLLLVIPRWMEQRRKNKVTSSELFEQAQQSIVKRLTDVHLQELEFYKQRIAEKELVAVYERKRAHKVMTAYGHASTHIKILEAQLADLGKKPALEFREPSYEDLNEEADNAIEQVSRSQFEKEPLIRVDPPPGTPQN